MFLLGRCPPGVIARGPPQWKTLTGRGLRATLCSQRVACEAQCGWRPTLGLRLSVPRQFELWFVRMVCRLEGALSPLTLSS